MSFHQFFKRLAFAALFIAASVLTTSATAQNASKSAVVTTDQVRAELMAYAPDGADPGKKVWLGLQLTHQPAWHTYWQNPGDSGLPITLQWTLPSGLVAGDIVWPLPTRITVGTLANYGYEGTVLLPVPLTIAPDFHTALPNSDIEVKLKATWLVCRTECVPQEGEFVLHLPQHGSTAINSVAFESSFKAQPVTLAGDSQIEVADGRLKLSVAGLPVALQGKAVELFPLTPEIMETGARYPQSWQGARWTASVALSEQRSQSPALLPLLLVVNSDGRRQGFVAQPTVSGHWPALVSVPASVAPGAVAAPGRIDFTQASQPTQSLGLWAALIGALLGGMILNLMPCVFPVLAIKVLSFARHAGDRRSHRISGLAYSVGVVLSFVALGALMLALRSAGEQLGWGFQLQAPAVVAALAALFTVVGLNLAGVFEFGQFLPDGLVTLQARNPALDAFLSGMLAVAIASPCTAPFMGASLGLALALPATQALMVFASIGVGMALPYLVASLVPAFARSLPRPGAWMVTLRHALAFPMFATVVWLVWVLGQQSGIDGAAALLALLVALSLVLWSFTLTGGSRILLAIISIAILALMTGTIGQNVIKMQDSSRASVPTGRWQPWAPGRVEQALATGVPVFVDFTAAWCVTCQYNQRTTLADPAVLADFEAKKVQLLLADWTRRDPAITTLLGQLGRNGVPVYVLYQNGKTPVVLSEILSVSEVRAALARL